MSMKKHFSEKELDSLHLQAMVLPTDHDGCIKESFHHFPKGTVRRIIFIWVSLEKERMELYSIYFQKV